MRGRFISPAATAPPSFRQTQRWTSGVATCSATLKTAGNQTITATDSVTASFHGSSNTITVAGAKLPRHLTVSAPGSTMAGTSFSLTVTALDQFNNTATGYAGTVHFTSSDGAATLSGSISTLTAGTANLSATLKTEGTQTITATDTVTVAITGTSATSLSIRRQRVTSWFLRRHLRLRERPLTLL